MNDRRFEIRNGLSDVVCNYLDGMKCKPSRDAAPILEGASDIVTVLCGAISDYTEETFEQLVDIVAAAAKENRRRRLAAGPPPVFQSTATH